MKTHVINQHTSIHMDNMAQMYLMYRNGYVAIDGVNQSHVIVGAAKIFAQHMNAMGCDVLVMARQSVYRILSELDIPATNINRMMFLMECDNFVKQIVL